MTWQLHSCSQFAAHMQAWDALQRRTTDTPFLESNFLLPLLQEFGNGRELLALHQGPTGTDVAAILQPARHGAWATFQPSQLPLGPWLAPATDDLARRLRTLTPQLPGLVLALGATQLDPRLQEQPQANDSLQILEYLNTSYLDISGTFDDYWEGRGKNLRQNTRKQRSKLQAEGKETQLECITDAADVAGALAEYGKLESAGWKAGTGTAIHPDNAQGRFYKRMLEAFCAEGRGRIYRYRFGDKVVAMDLCIDNGPLVVVLKTAYDESNRQLSPSTLMRQDQFRAWWEEGRFRRIEFYGKTLEWHTRWTDKERTLYHATAYRWPWFGRLMARRAQRQKVAESDPVVASSAP